MARTIQAVIDRVREILQDKDGVRYLDTEICAHLVDAIQEVRSLRPDLFVGIYTSPLPSVIVPEEPGGGVGIGGGGLGGFGETVVTELIPDQFFSAVCFYCAGSCELRDDEFAVDGRAMTLRSALASKLIKGM